MAMLGFLASSMRADPVLSQATRWSSDAVGKNCCCFADTGVGISFVGLKKFGCGSQERGIDAEMMDRKFVGNFTAEALATNVSIVSMVWRPPACGLEVLVVDSLG
jgi:hypothetical protein